MADAPIPLRFKLAFANEAEFLAKFGASLARGGVFVTSRSPKPVGTLIAFEFTLSDGTKVLCGEGRVVESLAPQGEGRSGMTLRFTSLDAATRERIDRALASAQGVGAAPLPAAPPAPATAKESLAEARRKRRQAILEPSAPVAFSPDPVLGIDLGTTNCRAAIHVDGQPKLLLLEGRSTALPAVVAFDPKGRVLVGTRAKAQLLVEPRSAIFGAKRLLGRRARSQKVVEMAGRFPYEIVADESGDAAVRSRDKVYTPSEIAAFLLEEIRKRASESVGRPVTRAVVGVPAYFNDRQRRAVRKAGQLAGLKVEQLVSEPTAVSIAYGYGKGLARKRLLIYDLGGGTFDASVVEVTHHDFEVVAAGGDNFLGGLDFDLRLADWLEKGLGTERPPGPDDEPLVHQRIRDAAESAKIALSDSDQARVHIPFLYGSSSAPVSLEATVDRPRFEALTEDLVARSVAVAQAVLEARQIAPAAIDEVVLVGGQSQTPRVRAALEQMLGREIRRELDPFDAVALGTALVGRAARDQEPGLFAVQFREVLSSAIGLGLQGGKFWRVFDRNTALPSDKTCALPVGAEGSLKLALYQGESERAEENEYLGALTIQSSARGEVNLLFSLCRDGILSLSARTPDGTTAQVSVATADSPEALRQELLACAPLPQAEPGEGLLGGIKKLLGRRS